MGTWIVSGSSVWDSGNTINNEFAYSFPRNTSNNTEVYSIYMDLNGCTGETNFYVYDGNCKDCSGYTFTDTAVNPLYECQTQAMALWVIQIRQNGSLISGASNINVSCNNSDVQLNVNQTSNSPYIITYTTNSGLTIGTSVTVTVEIDGCEGIYTAKTFVVAERCTNYYAYVTNNSNKNLYITGVHGGVIRSDGVGESINYTQGFYPYPVPSGQTAISQWPAYSICGCDRETVDTWQVLGIDISGSSQQSCSSCISNVYVSGTSMFFTYSNQDAPPCESTGFEWGECLVIHNSPNMNPSTCTNACGPGVQLHWTYCGSQPNQYADANNFINAMNNASFTVTYTYFFTSTTGKRCEYEFTDIVNGTSCNVSAAGSGFVGFPIRKPNISTYPDCIFPGGGEGRYGCRVLVQGIPTQYKSNGTATGYAAEPMS